MSALVRWRVIQRVDLENQSLKSLTMEIVAMERMVAELSNEAKDALKLKST